MQGASVRLLADVPEMETWLMRWLTIVSEIDIRGTTPGGYWAITHIPAYNNTDNRDMPLPSPLEAVLAIQPIDVIQIQLPEPIDTVENESHTEERHMAAAGYTGNANRQAIPIVVVRYATSLPGLGTIDVTFFLHLIRVMG